MAESLSKQLVSAISASWNERAPALLGASTLSLLASKEVSGDGMAAALAVAMTWSTAFALTCSGASGGVLICLFKSDEGEELDRLIKQPTDGLPRPGGRALIDQVAAGAAATLAADPSTVISFSPAAYIDLTIDEARLTAIVGDAAHIGTFSLVVGDDINSQALVLYAPNGSIEKATPVTSTVTPKPASTPAAAPATSTPGAPAQTTTATAPGRAPGRRPEAAPRNIERLLEVELDVIVRFGLTSVPLRDVVRMGIGSMLELNRAVDEPVELLVNGRPLARGEVVVVDGYYGVRITEIGPASERASSIL